MPLPGPFKDRRDRLAESTVAGMEELGHFPSEEARQRAVRSYIKAANRPLDVIVGSVILFVVTGGAVYLIGFALRLTLPAGTPRILPLTLIIGGAATVYYLVFRAMYRSGAPRELRRRLIAEGVPTCLKCGYALRGLPPATESCPECGRKIPARTRTLLAQTDQNATAGAPPTG